MKSVIIPILAMGCAGALCGQETQTAVPIDDMLFDSGLWKKTLSDIRGAEPPMSEEEKKWREKMAAEGKNISPRRKSGLDWLSADQSALQAPAGAFTLLGRKTGEVNVRGRGGVPGDVSISLFNRGDDGEITPTKYEETLADWKTALDGKLQVRAEGRGGGGAVQIRGWV